MPENKILCKFRHFIIAFGIFLTILYLWFSDITTVEINILFYPIQNFRCRALVSDNGCGYMPGRIREAEYIRLYDELDFDDNQMILSGISEESVDASKIIINSEEEGLVFNLYENLPKDKIKSYMSYKAITLKTSDQYRLQKIAYTDENGFRKVGDRYCVAVGSYFTDVIGTYLDIILSDGTVIECILADQKADKHTDADNILAGDGSLVEFVIDKSALNQKVKRSGDVSNLYDSWGNHVKTVIVYEIVEEF